MMRKFVMFNSPLWVFVLPRLALTLLQGEFKRLNGFWMNGFWVHVHLLHSTSEQAAECFMMWSRALPNAQKKATSDAGLDGLDAMLAECQMERSSSAQSPARAAAKPVATATALPPPPTQQRVLTSEETRARDAVVALQQALADAEIAAAVDKTLKSAGAVDTWRYYDDRPELEKYTIERELSRNKFVVTEDGVAVRDAAARLGALEGDDAYLLRLANQSLFGDALVALSSALDSSGAQAAVSNAAGATYHVALGREPSLEGRLRVTVNVPSSTPSGRLALASLDVVVTARLRPRALMASVGRADLAKGVFDDDIRRAAVEIAALAAPPAAPEEESDVPIVGAGRVFKGIQGAAGAAAARLKARAAAPAFSDLLREAADREPPTAAGPSFSDLLRETADREAAPPPPAERSFSDLF